MPEEMEVNVPVGGEEAEGRFGGRELVRALNEQHRIQIQEARVRLNAQANELLAPLPRDREVQPVGAGRGGIFRAFGEAAPMKEEKKGLRGEELFKLILSGIKEVYGVDAIVAGGAVRDVAAGTEEHKDVDVFIPMKWSDFNAHSSQLGWEVAPYKEGKVPYDGKLKRLPATERGRASVQGVSVDLVFMDGELTPKYVNSFPVNAQKCVFTLENGISVSPQAQLDIDNKQFTIDPEIKDKDQIKLIKDKVNGWKKRASSG